MVKHTLSNWSILKNCIGVSINVIEDHLCHLKFFHSKKKEYPSVPQRPPHSNTSVPHKDHTFSAPKILQFNTKNLSVQHQNPAVPHQKPFSSTPKTPQFNTETVSLPHSKPLGATPETPQFNKKTLSSTPKGFTHSLGRN